MDRPSDAWKKQTLLFLTSQAVSLFGSSLVSYAILWRITLDTQSGFMMSLYLVFGFLPTFILSPFAGVWADRYDRKRLIMMADGLIAGATLLMAILFMSGYKDLWLYFVIPLIRALGSAVQTPSVNALLPQIVPQEQLMRTNGLFASLNSAIMLVSPMVSGALLSFTALELILMIDVVTALAAISILWFTRVAAPEKPVEVQKHRYWQDLTDGLRYIRQNDYVGRFFVFITILYLLVTPTAMLTPLQVTRSFGSDIWRLTAIEIVFSGGMLGGGLLITSWGGFKNRIRTIAFATLIIGLTTLLLGVARNFWLYLAAMAIAGISLPFFNTPATVLLQQKVAPDYLGRVFGIMGMIASGVMPMAMFVYGPLADRIRIEWLLIGAGIFMSALAGALAMNRALVKAGDPLVLDRENEHAQREPLGESSAAAGPDWTACPAGQPNCQA